MNLNDFQTSKLNVEETMSAKGGFGSATSGGSTVCSGSDTDCKNRDCDTNDDTIANF